MKFDVRNSMCVARCAKRKVGRGDGQGAEVYLYTGRARAESQRPPYPRHVRHILQHPFPQHSTKNKGPLQKRGHKKGRFPRKKSRKYAASTLLSYQGIAGQSSASRVAGMPGAGMFPNVTTGAESTCCAALCAKSMIDRAAFCAIHSLSESICPITTDTARGKAACTRAQAAAVSSPSAAGSRKIPSNISCDAPSSRLATATASAGAYPRASNLIIRARCCAVARGAAVWRPWDSFRPALSVATVPPPHKKPRRPHGQRGYKISMQNPTESI